MKVVVCIRQSANGEINPFDASAYETALRIPDAEVTVLSMGPEKTADFLLGLTRLGAKNAVLLTDKAFAGADTLATAYTLSLGIKRLSPDLIICGRQSVDGDTGQVGPCLAISAGYSLLTNVMSVSDGLTCITRGGKAVKPTLPALITVEKSLNLRLPSIRSKLGTLQVLSANDLGADTQKCGLLGSPTKVVKSFANDKDRRKCRFIELSQLKEIFLQALEKEPQKLQTQVSEIKLKNVWAVGEAPREMALTVAENVTVIELSSPYEMAEKIKNGNPDAVIWGSDAKSKAVAPQVAYLLQTGLCADCTRLETDGNELYMYRPACSGNIIAKIKCVTRPPMATVRTPETAPQKAVLGIGFGAKSDISLAKAVAESKNFGLATTRKMVDNDFMPYNLQVGLTGKTINPNVYVALGISGAVHHIAGIKNSGTVIAVNPDKSAEIFDYADFGILCTAEQALNGLENI